MESTQAATVDQVKAAIDAMPASKATAPNMPVDTLIAEARGTHAVAVVDLPVLTSKGLDAAYVEVLPLRINALSEIEGEWQRSWGVREEFEKQWAAIKPEFIQKRDDMLHHMRFAYRRDANLLSKVSRFAKGNSIADTVQDYMNISKLVEENGEPIAAIGVDLAVVDEFKQMSVDIGELHARATQQRAESNRDIVRRDKAVAYLKEALDEVRAYGRYAFHNDRKHANAYGSEYHRKAAAEGNSEAEAIVEAVGAAA